MKISKQHISVLAQRLIDAHPNFRKAYYEICEAIVSMVWPTGSRSFSINDTKKNANGVVPIKQGCYSMLEDKFIWYREKPLEILKKRDKGGPIDVYKVIGDAKIGLEFETGNISSAHRSMNKLLLGCIHNELNMAVLILPVHALSYYLTDRVSNYEELEPYFELADDQPVIFLGFDADSYQSDIPFIPKGKDGMSPRSIRRWINAPEEGM